MTETDVGRETGFFAGLGLSNGHRKAHSPRANGVLFCTLSMRLQTHREGDRYFEAREDEKGVGRSRS